MKTMRWRFLAICAIVVGVLYVGFLIYERSIDATVLQKQTIEDAISTVAVVHPEPVPATETITLPGNIVGWYEAAIYARVTGYVAMWYKDYGAKVKKDDILAEISTPALDAEYRQVGADLNSERARYTLAEVTARRYLAMRPSHAVSEQTITVQVQNMKAQKALVEAAEQRVKNIEAFIKFKQIRAPFDGVVIQRNINVGDLVSREGNLSTSNAKSNLFTVAVVDKVRVFVSVPEQFGHFPSAGTDGRRDGAANTASAFHSRVPHRRRRVRCEHAYGGHCVHHRQYGPRALARLLRQGTTHGAGRSGIVHYSVHRLGVPRARHTGGRGDGG